MSILKISVLGLASVICGMIVKEQKPQFSVAISIAAGIMIGYNAIFRLQTLSGLFKSLMEYSAMKESYFLILIKIVGISYIADFSSGICKESGYQAIAGQIEVFGKAAVLTVSAPVMLAVFQTVTDFLK